MTNETFKQFSEMRQDFEGIAMRHMHKMQMEMREKYDFVPCLELQFSEASSHGKCVRNFVIADVKADIEVI